MARGFILDVTQLQKVASMAAAIRAGEGAWAWNAEVVDWAGNEVALIYQGKTLRLDRLVRRKDTGAWWVLDHKSKNQPQRDAGLVEQLETYRSALLALYPGAEVEAAFLTGAGGAGGGVRGAQCLGLPVFATFCAGPVYKLDMVKKLPHISDTRANREPITLIVKTWVVFTKFLYCVFV
nr:hypothetical protein [uncultured Albidiferax sp.]